MASELASAEKLRKYTLYDKGERLSAYINADELANEIEREVSERYMLLPVDADGVPIRIGDTVREVDDRVPMKVMSLTFYEDCVDVNACGMNPNLLRHVKPRTLEDALCDMIHEYGSTDALTETIATKYAAELRGMMEVDDD